jgi:hypothetical protein
VPCPPEGCLEPTPQPPLPQTGVDFSLTVDVDGDGIPDCGTGPDDRAECLADPGATFTATVSLNALPVGTADYTGVDIGLELASLRPTTYVDWEWPDCGFPAQHFDQRLRRYLIGCASGGALTSSYGGVLLNVEFVCDRNGSLTLRHDELHSQLSDWYVSYSEPLAGEGVAITCGDLIAGDADCNIGVDAVDAAVTLQKEAALLAFLGCPQQSDVNLDNQTNSVGHAPVRRWPRRYAAAAARRALGLPAPQRGHARPVRHHESRTRQHVHLLADCLEARPDGAARFEPCVHVFQNDGQLEVRQHDVEVQVA